MYMLWQVFENPVRTTFYIINKNTKEVQSTWKNYLEAKATCDKLNNFVGKPVKKGA